MDILRDKVRFNIVRILTVLFTLSLVAYGCITILTMRSCADPWLPFHKTGTILIDDTPAAGEALSAWIDGTRYGFYITGSGGNTDIMLNTTVYNPLVKNPVKTGGEGTSTSDGDIIIYRLDAKSGKRLFANENDRFIEGGLSHGNITFSSGQAGEINGLKIFKIYFRQTSGIGRVYLVNTANTTITVNNNWLLKTDGKSAQDYFGWQTLIPNQGIPPGKSIQINIGSNISAAAGDLEIAWKDTLNNIATGDWVVTDRAEWSATPREHDGSPSNTTLPDWIGAIPVGSHLERADFGRKDTDNCSADFGLVLDSSPAFKVTVNSPISGVSWETGTTHNITWTINGTSFNTVFVNLSSDGGATFSGLTSQSPSAGIFNWAIPRSLRPENNYRIRVEVADDASPAIRNYSDSGIFTIQARPTSISSVSIFPGTSIVIFNNTHQNFTSQAFDAYGTPIMQGVTYSWGITGNIGSVSPTKGIPVVFASGSTATTGIIWVNASFDGDTMSNSTAIEVTKIRPTLHHLLVSPSGPIACHANEKVNFSAIGYTSGNTAIGGVAYSWSASPSSIGTIARATKQQSVFTTALSQSNLTGAIFVNATYWGTRLQNSVNIAVLAYIEISNITITPTQITLKAGSSQQFTAKAYGSSGNLLNGIDFQWFVKPIALGNITQTGRFTAVKQGNCMVMVQAGDKNATANVTVTLYEPWELGYLSITPASDNNLQMGTIVNFTIIAYAEGNGTIIPASLISSFYEWKLEPVNIGFLVKNGSSCTFNTREPGSGVISVTCTYNNITRYVNATVSVQGRSPGFDITGVFVAIGLVVVIVIVIRSRRRGGR